MVKGLVLFLFLNLPTSTALAEVAIDPSCNCVKPAFSNLISTANDVLNVESSRGFETMDSEICKPHADAAKGSVLQMVLVTGQHPIPNFNDHHFRANLIEQLKAEIKKDPSTENMINLLEIESCITIKSKECIISTGTRNSSVVLVGDGSKALTVFHNFQILLQPTLTKLLAAGLTAQQSSDWINQGTFSAYLLNFDQQFVGTTGKVAFKVNTTAEQIESAWQNLGDKGVLPYAEPITINFQKKMGTGLPIAKTSPPVGSRSRIFGYPGETKIWEAIGGVDADGHSLRCTSGPVITLDTAIARGGISPSAKHSLIAEQFKNRTLFVAAPSYGGMSGGAVLNEQGELVALHTQGTRAVENPTATNPLVIKP